MKDKAIAWGMEFESLVEHETDLELALDDNVVLPPNWGCCCGNLFNFPCEKHEKLFPEEQ